MKTYLLLEAVRHIADNQAYESDAARYGVMIGESITHSNRSRTQADAIYAAYIRAALVPADTVHVVRFIHARGTIESVVR